MQQFSCPSCTAPLQIENRFAKLVTCDFCNHVSLITDSGLDPTGKVAKLTQFPSKLYVDATGTIRGKTFRTLGRLRYQTETAYWDEWYLILDDGQRGWLVEDAGSFSYYAKKTLSGAVPPFDSLKIGQTLKLEGYEVFITELGEGQIAGGEGQLAFQLVPGEQIQYVDGTSNGRLASLEYAEDEIEFSLGVPIEEDQLVVDDDF